MKSLLCTVFVITTVCASFVADAKRPPKPPKEPKTPLSSEQKQAIVAGAAQVMGGVLTVIQNPHDKHNVGNSVATMLHGFINILVEKIGNRKIDINDIDAVEECIEQICQEINEQINEIIRAKKS